jgi:hypothetical protein
VSDSLSNCHRSIPCCARGLVQIAKAPIDSSVDERFGLTSTEFLITFH